MSFLNLSFAEFLAVFGTLSAVLVTLYLLDRSRRKITVSTLRFWRPAGSAPQQTQKRRIQQPWSLILQLASIALLLLAVAQLQWGSRGRGRDHILILDTSAWMNARTPKGTLMDEARSSALAYVRSLPSADRILLLRADGLATPAGVLESDHRRVERAIRDSHPGASALNLQQAFEFAREFERGHASRPGEIVFAGAGRIGAGEPVTAPPPGLRVLPTSSQVENVGLRKVGLKRSEADPSAWDVFVAARNYGTSARTVPVEIRFGGAIAGTRSLNLPPGLDEGTTFTLRTRAAGLMEVRLVANDSLPGDDRAVVELPSQRTLKVVVYSPHPESLKPVLTANPHVQPIFRAPSAYSAQVDADVVVLDEFAPPSAPPVPTIWIEPPGQTSPFHARSSVQGAKLKRWHSDHELGAGLHTRDLDIGTTLVFAPEPEDIAVAEIEQGPVILARESKGSMPKVVVFGFHPVRSGMRYELATPIVFANVLRWMHPDLFRRWELNAGPVGSVSLPLDKGTAPESVSVRSDDGSPVPYTIIRDELRFYSGTPGNVRLTQGDKEVVYSLTLPELGETTWTAPAGTRTGVPRRNALDRAPKDLWPWLALLGMVGIAVEWSLWGRGQRRIRLPKATMARTDRVHWWKRKAS